MYEKAAEKFQFHGLAGATKNDIIKRRKPAHSRYPVRGRAAVQRLYSRDHFMSESNGDLTNENTCLTPVTSFESGFLEFDFPTLEIGVAEYEEGPTGCTVFCFPKGSTVVTDIRGGAPGTMMSHREGWIDAVCLAGGSIYGFEAATGISAELLAARGYDTDWMNIAIVAGAVIFDFNAIRKNKKIYPDHKLGRAAFGARRAGIFPLGARGAGASATVGKWLGAPYRPERAGQGAAFYGSNGARIAVFTVVNSVGALVDRTGRAVRGHFYPEQGRRYRVDEVAEVVSPDGGPNPPPGNTTLTVVVINQKMDLREHRQLAKQVHASMARAIQPFHTMHDGDVLYAITTNEQTSTPLNYNEASHLASELAWDAVLNSF
jgi:L-aminopeptidase/D-esterase-like protein